MNPAKLLAAASMLLGVLLAGCGGGGSGGGLNYTALGASDAIGVGATPLTNGYVYRIRDGLDQEGYDVSLTNLGIPGAEADDIADTETQAMDFGSNPDLVTIFTGANDVVAGVSPEDFQKNLQDIFNNVRDHSPGLVVIATLPALQDLPRFQSEPDRDVTASRVNTFNSIIISEANSNGAQIADLRSINPDADVTAADGYHPNDQGHEIIAQEFLKVIHPALPP